MSSVPIETVGEALARLVSAARNGEEVVFTDNRVPVARLIPLLSAKRRRCRGTAEGLILHVAPDFDAPLDDFRDYS